VAFGDITKTYPELVKLGDANGVTFGDYAAAQDKNGFATTKAFADKWGITTLSDLAAKCGPISLGGPIDCDTRSDCQLGLENVYGIKISEFKALDGAGPLTKAAIRNGDVVLGVLFTSDGTLG
jgi:osmoprotectant transport system substrate-binding protein